MDLEAVTRTDDDALAARASAVKIGYWRDDYIKYFVKDVERKAPVINRGTHVRTFAINQIVRSFLAGEDDNLQGRRRQIISLGAGSDTRFFTLAAEALKVHGHIPFLYHEIDFPSVCQRKAMTMAKKKILLDLLRSPGAEPVIDGRRGSIYSDAYCLHPLDLAKLPETGDALFNVDWTLETLFISEVCLIYMDVEAADNVLAWTRRFPRAAFVLYEPIRGNDAFGQMMVKNLARRGLVLRTLEKYATLALQERRLLDAGFTDSRACTMEDIYQNWLPADDRVRTNSIEIFDEIEEWVMLAEHYCVAVGWRGLTDTNDIVREFS